jgi:hypothetical protein
MGKSVTFYDLPDFKLVMARNEIRKDNGDLEVKPQAYQKCAGHWWPVPFSAAPQSLRKRVYERRLTHSPVFRNPIGTLPIDYCP